MRMSRYRRRGGMYIVVLGTATIVTVIGLSALLFVRVERRSVEMGGDHAQARLYAQSAVELGFHRIENDANWRTTFVSGTWEQDRVIGGGSFTLQGIDPVDGDLTNSDSDPVVLTGIGMQGEARYKLRVTLNAVADPIDALGTAIHAGSIAVTSTHALTATGAPASTNGLLQLDVGATITGDVDAASLSNGGTITGTITVPAPPKGMPDATVIGTYAALATTIVAPNAIDKAVLAPGVNPWGATDPDGVYLVNNPGGTYNITNTRIHGTLVMQIPGGKVVVDQAVLMQNYRADYPVLIVDGNVELLYPSDGNALSESTLGTNFNPPGAPYGGATDSLQDDTYPSEIQGLVHMTGTLLLRSTARVRGVVISESAVTADGNNEIVYDANLYAIPPVGYTKTPVMRISQGTYRQTVD